jgi:hypothetical protein
VVTGYGVTDPDLRKIQANIKPPFSVKIGDTWYSYNRADPFGMFLGAVASYAEIAGQLDELEADELVTAIAIATTQSITSKTWLRGPSEFMEAVMEPDRFGAQWLQRNASTFLAALVLLSLLVLLVFLVLLLLIPIGEKSILSLKLSILVFQGCLHISLLVEMCGAKRL